MSPFVALWLFAAASGPGTVELQVEDAAFAARLSTALTFDGWKVVETSGDYVLRGRLVVNPGPTGFVAVGEVKLVARAGAVVVAVLPLSVVDRPSVSDALDVAARRVVVKLREATAARGGSELTLELEGLPLTEVEELQKTLGAVAGVVSVTRGALADGVQVYALKVNGTPAQLAKALSATAFKKGKLVIVTVKTSGLVRARLEK